LEFERDAGKEVSLRIHFFLAGDRTRTATEKNRGKRKLTLFPRRVSFSSLQRSHHLSTLLAYLSPLIEPPTPLLPDPSLLLSHAPYIRHLVAQDDAFVLAEAQGLRVAEEGGRTIRPSARAAMIALAIGRTGGKSAAAGSSRLYGYQRWVVGLEEEELKEVRGSGLRLDW